LKDELIGATVWDVEELSALIADVETDRKGVPVLLKQYLKLGGELVAFDVDRRFADALDGLIVVDLRKTDGPGAGALHGQRRRSPIPDCLIEEMKQLTRCAHSSVPRRQSCRRLVCSPRSFGEMPGCLRAACPLLGTHGWRGPGLVRPEP